MSFCKFVFIASFFFLCGSVSADSPKDPALVLLNSVGDFLNTLGQAKLTEAEHVGALGETGRGKKVAMLAIPLIVGFKVAGIIIAAMGALKVLVLKTVVMSGLAIGASLILAIKFVYEKMKGGQQHAVDATPYYAAYAPPHMVAQPLGWEPLYDVQAGSTDLSPADLQAHYSQQLVATDNHTAYNYIPVAERKSHQRVPYRTTVYKTVVKQVDK